MLSERMISVPPMINISGGSFAMSALVAAPASALVQVPDQGRGHGGLYLSAWSGESSG